MKKYYVAIVLLISATVLAQRATPPTADELDVITQSGRELAEYDAAAWRATDAVMALNPKTSELGKYIAKKIDGKWHVVFGHLNEKKDAFVVSYESVQEVNRSEVTPKLLESVLAKEDGGFYLFAARAIDTALKQFVVSQNRSYNVAVLPADEGELFVYIYPASTVAGVYPIGGDSRFLVSPDGLQVVEHHRMHNSIIEPDPKKAKDIKEIKAGFHTHVIDDIPEDTDVFHVLQTHVPEYVASRKYFYIVRENGSIICLGETDKVLDQNKN